MTGKVFGQSVGRLEDADLLRGKGRFVDDIRLPGMLEAAFVLKLNALSGEDGTALHSPEPNPAAIDVTEILSSRSRGEPHGRCIEVRSSADEVPREAARDRVMPLSKPRRQRDRDHLKFVADQPCMACGRTPSDAHHLKFAEQRALGHKVSDEFTVPLCRLHHRELHRHGDERVWWQKLNLDPLPAASALWAQTRPVVSEIKVPDDGTTALQERPPTPTHSSQRKQAQNCETQPFFPAEMP